MSIKKEKKPKLDFEDEFSVEQNRINKCKPAALRFWETLETDKPEFKYNTIHRMSGNRRILPQPPETALRSKSVERENKMAVHLSLTNVHISPNFGESVQNSFDNSPRVPSRISRGSTRSSGGSGTDFYSRFEKIPPDGASLQEFVNL